MKKPYKTAIIEIAKMVDKHRAEDSKRGEMCREIDKIIYTAFESSNKHKVR